MVKEREYEFVSCRPLLKSQPSSRKFMQNARFISHKTSKINTRTKRLSPKNTALFLLIVVLCLGLAYLSFRKNEITDTKYYFTSSKYEGITSKFVERNSSSEQTSIEYPVTENQKINDTIAKLIDEKDEDFRSLLEQKSGHINEPFTNMASYQVSHNDSDFLSITVSIKQDTHGAHPANYSRFWTFDKRTGEVVGLKNLLGDSDENLENLSQLIQKKANEIVKKKDQNYAVDPISDDNLANFIVSENSISFPFEPGSIAIYAAGDITVSIGTDEVVKYLQNDVARKLFDLPEINSSANSAIPQVNAGTCDKCIALTFDDGPGAHTMRLLDMLDKYNAKATFFVVGEKIAGRQDILKQQVARGHQLGNHSWRHPDLTQISIENMQSEFTKTSEAIKFAVGISPTIMRPPCGAINQTVSQQLKAHGMSAILWSVDTRDWADRNSQIVCNRAVSNARSGAIILFHDIHPTSVDAIPCVLDALSKQGYKFVTIDTLFGGKTQPGVSYFSGSWRLFKVSLKNLFFRLFDYCLALK